jgi:high-affinity iron transporter
MKRGFITVGFLFLLWGCSRNHEGSRHPGIDSAAVAESTAVVLAATPLPFEAQRGKDVYDQYCAVCHGTGGAGDGFNSYNLNPKPHSLADSAYVAALSDQDLRSIVSRGGSGMNLSAEMPSYRGTLSALDIEYVCTYIRYLANPQVPR